MSFTCCRVVTRSHTWACIWSTSIFTWNREDLILVLAQTSSNGRPDWNQDAGGCYEVILGGKVAGDDGISNNRSFSRGRNAHVVCRSQHNKWCQNWCSASECKKVLTRWNRKETLCRLHSRISRVWQCNGIKGWIHSFSLNNSQVLMQTLKQVAWNSPLFVQLSERSLFNTIKKTEEIPTQVHQYKHAGESESDWMSWVDIVNPYEHSAS